MRPWIILILFVSACGGDSDAGSHDGGQCQGDGWDVRADISEFEFAHNACETDDDCVAVGVFEGDCDGRGRELTVAVNPDAADEAGRLIAAAVACGYDDQQQVDGYDLNDAYCYQPTGTCQVRTYLQCLPPPPPPPADAAIDARSADARNAGSTQRFPLARP